MAITAVSSCLGPPPLPPGKRYLQRSSKKLSSTYHSFRDPAVEAWIPGTVQYVGTNTRDKFNQPAKKNNGYLINGLNGKKNGGFNLVRSRSEGNLTRSKNDDSNNYSSSPLDKCIKAIYGSWRNLMQRKFIV